MAKKDEPVKAPEDMTDEELAKAVEVKEEPETPKEEPEPEEEPKEELTEEPAPEVETLEEEEKPPSRREQLRVQQLLERYGPPPPKRPEGQKGIDYQSALDADPEVVKQLETDRQVVSDEAYRQGIQRAETISWRNNLKLEAPIVEEKYDFLNPKDEAHFNPAVANAMNTKYLRFIGYNSGDPSKGVPETVQIPDVSYREFVESEMEFVDELASQKNLESTKNIVKQTAQTGLRPDGSSAKRLNLNKPPEDMSVEELYAAIGQTPPKTT